MQAQLRARRQAVDRRAILLEEQLEAAPKALGDGARSLALAAHVELGQREGRLRLEARVAHEVGVPLRVEREQRRERHACLACHITRRLILALACVPWAGDLRRRGVGGLLFVLDLDLARARVDDAAGDPAVVHEHALD